MPILGSVISRFNGMKCGAIPLSVPMAWLDEAHAQRIHGQTLKRLKERGGLGYDEVVGNITRATYDQYGRLDEYKCMLYIRYRIQKEHEAKRGAEGK